MGKILKHICFGVVVCTIVFFFGTSATATPIPIASVDGDWSNYVGGAGTVNINNTSPTGGSIRWGSGGSSQSGYDFAAVALPIIAQSDGTNFALGTFTHLNFPINAGTSITAVDLTVSLGNAFTTSATFHYDHNETPNTGGSAHRDSFARVSKTREKTAGRASEVLFL